ncbi:MAG: homoserine O-acetyltransferase [Chitinophagia bacterium]|jgi:homoserine O-acetyltransferase
MGFFIAMLDEITMNRKLHTYQFKGGLLLESGKTIRDFPLAYTTLGALNADKSNVVWIFHAMTANSDPSEWWPGMVGEGKCFDPTHHFIICVNMPGSCYGSISPLDKNPETGERYYQNFPFFTPLDMARAFDQLRISLGIEQIFVGLGGSMGGQQLIAWAAWKPGLFNHIIPIATNAFHSPWGKAFNASQRMSIEADPSWKEKNEAAGMEGMKIARSIALISYRHYETYDRTQQDTDKALENTRSESYQKYQGEKLAKRFNALSYYMLTKSMDSHHLGRGVMEAEEILAHIQSKTLVIGISSDLLYPVNEQQFLAKHIPGARIEIIESFYGHDGFLLENEKLTLLFKNFLNL